MSLSRFAPSLRAQPQVVLLSFRSHATTTTAVSTDEKPGFFQKIAYRFKGIPLAGETTRPKSLFDDMGKQFVPPPLPAIPKDFKEGPERDLTNYPYPPKLEHCAPVRMLVFPNSWFTAFEKVTGTSGGYLFFGGLFAFLANKEIWVYDENGALLFALIAIYVISSRAFGFKLDQWAYNGWTEQMNKYKGLIEADLKEAIEFRKTSAAEAASLEAVKADFPVILKENLALQLEAVYRQNVEKAYSELKRRLDYLQEVEETKQRFERDIFIKSVLNGVQKAIDTNEGNIKSKYLDSCIAQIKTLNI